jgi:uncharacterized membrane protein
MNWTVIILVSIIAIALVIFLIIRNKKDKTRFEESLTQDYRKPRDNEGEIQIDKETK